MLDVRELHVRYTLSQWTTLDLHVDEGEVVPVLIGANGAGKLRAANAIAGLVRPGEGRIEFAGEDVCGLKRIRRVGEGSPW